MVVACIASLAIAWAGAPAVAAPAEPTDAAAETTTAPAETTTAPAEPTKDELERQKLIAERGKLDAERRKADRDNSWSARTLPALLTFIVGLGTLLYAVKKGTDELQASRAESKRQHDLDAQARKDAEAESKRQHDLDAQARKDADAKRFDERFITAMEASASKDAAARRGGAVVLDSLIRDTDRAAAAQGMNLLLALLQDLETRENDASTRRVLRQTLERRLRAPDASKVATEFDFRYLAVPGIDLSGVVLNGDVDLAFSDLSGGTLRKADLSGTKGWHLVLVGTRLRRARLAHVEWAEADARTAKFHNAILTKANLWKADLRGADFYRASLRDANLRGAKLAGAQFNLANVAGAQFRQAELDAAAIASLAAAVGWEEAEFDAPVRAEIEKAASDTGEQ